MQGNAVLAGVALAIAALSVSSSPAAARLAGAELQAFIETSIKSCSDSVHKNHPNVPAKTIEIYCRCMADAEVDITTDADIEYMGTHDAPTEDYTARVRTLAPACNAKAGAK
jgi:hypothetical protein